MIKQFKRWFSIFGMVNNLRSDNGRLFSSNTFKDCNEFSIQLNLCAPYNPKSLGAAERVIKLVMAIMKRADEDGSNFEEAFAAFKNTRDKSGYSPNQLFFLRNCRDPKLPSLLAKLSAEEMVKARDRVRVGRKVKKETRRRKDGLS